MIYEHGNIQQCFKEQALLTYIVHLLDKYNKKNSNFCLRLEITYTTNMELRNIRV